MTSADLTSLLRHSDWMRRLARDLVRDPHLADDLVQEAWAAAARQPPAPRAARSWLRRVITNAAHQHHRREVGRSIQLESEPAGAGSSAAEVVERAEMLHDVSARVLAQPEPYRTTLIRRYFEGWMPERIASEEGVPVSTVKTRLQRGLARLREELDAEHGDRRAWAVVLAPFAGVPSGTATGSAEGTAAATPTALPPVLIASLAAAVSLALVVALAVPQRGGTTSEPLQSEAASVGMSDSSARSLSDGRSAVLERDAAGVKAANPASRSSVLDTAAAASIVGWRGTVRDADGGPLADARVRLVDRYSRILREAIADGEGSYALTFEHDTDLSVDVEFAFLAEQFVVLGTALEVVATGRHARLSMPLLGHPDEVETLDFVVPAAKRLEVVTVDAETGAAVAGVSVQARPGAAPSADPLRADWQASAVSGADGRAELAIGRRDAVLLIARPTSTHFGASEAFVAAPDLPFELRLERAPTSLHIEVVDANTGAPVPGAELRDMETGALLDGIGLAQQERAVAVAPGYLPGPVPMRDANATVRVRLQPARDVEFEVLCGGEPVPDGTAHVEWSVRHSPSSRTVETPVEAGRAVLPIAIERGRGANFVAGLEKLDVVVLGEGRQSFGDVVAGLPCSDRVALELDPETAPLRLRILGADGGPVDSAVVTAGAIRRRGPDSSNLPLHSKIEWRNVTDATGRTTFELPRAVRSFWISWDGDLEVVEWPASDEELELNTPHDATRIRGALLDASGQPAREAARLIGHLELRALAGDSSVFVPLDPDGTFEARGVTPGPYEVVTPGFGDVLVQSGRAEQSVPAPEPYRWGLDLRDGRTGEPLVWEGRAVVRIEFGQGERSVVTLYGDRPFALPAMSTAPESFVVDVPGYQPLTWTADSEASGSRERRLTLLLYPD